MITALGGTDPNAVDLSDPIGFSMYLGLAGVLYAIRETDLVSIRFIPIIGILLGILFAWIQFEEFDGATLEAGLRLGLLGIGSVATIKYLLDRTDYTNRERDKDEKGNL